MYSQAADIYFFFTYLSVNLHVGGNITWIEDYGHVHKKSKWFVHYVTRAGQVKKSESQTVFEPVISRMQVRHSNNWPTEGLLVSWANYYVCRTVSEQWLNVCLQQLPTCTIYSLRYLLFSDNIVVTLGHGRNHNTGWNVTSQLFPVRKRKRH